MDLEVQHGRCSFRWVRSARSGRLPGGAELHDFEQELVDQYALAMVGAGITDGQVASERSTLFSFIGFLARPVWTATPADADRYLSLQRKGRRLAHSTVRSKA